MTYVLCTAAVCVTLMGMLLVGLLWRCVEYFIKQEDDR